MILVKVAILDDEKKDSNRVKEYFHAMSNQQIQVHCDEYTSVNEQFYNNYDLYVVDIELGNDNGLDVAREIKRKCENAVLIINSKRNDLVFESFKFGVFFFIRKDHFEIDMSFAQSRLMEHFITTKQVYKYKHKQMELEIPHERIVYIEKVNSNIEIHLNDGRILNENKSMKQVIHDIENHRFIQCHQSFIVNLYYVNDIENNDFIILNEKVQISRRYLKKSKQAYIHYLNTKA